MTASSNDCPCCHKCLSPGIDTDRALVVAFLGGHAARDCAVPIERALCARHAHLAGEAMGFAIAGGAHKCRWCDARATRLLKIGTTNNTIVDVYFCAPHMDRFVAEQTAKGLVAGPPIRLPDGEPS